MKPSESLAPALAGPRRLVLGNGAGFDKVSLTFNLAHMFARLGRRVALVDLDPQSNLTALALPERELEELWDDPAPGRTVATCVQPVLTASGELVEPIACELAEDVYLLPGDLRLSRFESKLAHAWPQAMLAGGDPAGVVTALDRLAARFAELTRAELVVFDVGPGFGALNRAVLLASDAVVLPLAPDLFGLRGLRNLGDALHEWREERALAHGQVPRRPMRPIGYVVQQHLGLADQPHRTYQRWLAAIPGSYARDVLRQTGPHEVALADDSHCLGVLRPFASLVPLAQATHKPLFELRHADGITGSQYQSVARATKAFEQLATTIMARLAAVPDESSD